MDKFFQGFIKRAEEMPTDRDMLLGGTAGGLSAGAILGALIGGTSGIGGAINAHNIVKKHFPKAKLRLSASNVLGQGARKAGKGALIGGGLGGGLGLLLGTGMAMGKDIDSKQRKMNAALDDK